MATKECTDFLCVLQSKHIADFCCLACQVILTAITLFNIYRNRDLFPIKQLSPLCTGVASLCFLASTSVILTAKIIQTKEGYYIFNPIPAIGQCRSRNHPEILALSLLNIAIRQLPVILFTLKTFRVCLCFIKRDIHPIFLTLFSREAIILLMGAMYSAMVAIVTYFDFESTNNPTRGRMTFELLCPKEPGYVDWIFTLLRYLLMSIVYYMSIKTYPELDFKRFLVMIFMLNNTQILLRLVLINIDDLEKTTYHEFYYHAMAMELIGSIIMFFYSQFNAFVKEPPGEKVLDDFDSFLGFSGGVMILQCYAKHLDLAAGDTKHQRHYKTFENLMKLKEIIMKYSLDEHKIYREHKRIQSILNWHELDKPSLKNYDQVMHKLSQYTIQIKDLRQLQSFLEQYCKKFVYKMWKKTESCKYFREEFKKNIILNQRMEKLGIQIKLS